MKIVKFSDELVEKMLTKGYKSPVMLLKKGLPKRCHLVNARVANNTLELWFTEVEDCEEITLEVEVIKDKEVKK